MSPRPTRNGVPEVFDYAHRLVFQLLRDGTLDGLCIDQVDGLFDPEGYLRRFARESLRWRLGAEFLPGWFFAYRND